MIVPFYDWNEHFNGHCKKLDGIKHFILDSSSSPGVVKAKQTHIDTTMEFNLLTKTKLKPRKNDLPALVTPAGLCNNRQWYPYNKIRHYCSEDTKDLVCP